MSDFPAELAMNGEEDEAQGLTDKALEQIVQSEIEDAISFIDSDVGPLRAEAMKYYRGDPLGNEEEGRSAVVSRDVADTINAALPSLMRVFFGPEHVVEFVPECEEDEPVADQQTDYINYIVTRDNDGFEVIYAAIKNALREKAGFIKYWWDDSVTVSTKRYTGLDMDGLTKLLEDVNSSIEAEITDKEEVEGPPDEQTGQPTMTLNVTLKLKRKADRARIAAVPPEEFLISRDATDIDTARLVAHRRDITVSELIAMGYDREFVEENSGEEDDLATSKERMARNAWTQDRAFHQGASADKTTRICRYVEAYVLVDRDGDGIAELVKVCTIGGKLAHAESVDERPFAAFMCDPEPHTFFGESYADKTMDIQRLKTALQRSGLDSLSTTIFPRMVVTDGANIDDVLNNEVGAIIRAKAQTDVTALVSPTVADHALTWLAYADEVRENRTGMSKVSMGLDAEALQNTTATAAEGHFTRSQERIELTARILASGMRRLFRGLSRLVAANQRKERMVKLRNQWVQIDPRSWRVDMDVAPNVALGGGSQDQQMQLLSVVLQKQEGIFQEYGLQNPFVTVGQYLDTLAKFIELGGRKNPQAFFNEPEEAEQIMAQKAQQPPPPDPKMLEVQAKADLARQTAEAQATLDRDKAEAAAQTQREALAAKTQAEQLAAIQQHELKMTQLAAELDMEREKLAIQLQMQREVGLLKASHAHEANMAKVSTSVDQVETGGEPG